MGPVFSVLVVSLLLGGGPSAAAGAGKQTVSDDLWSRTERVFAYDAPHRARYPSLARNEAGQLVLLFTHVTEDQESSGLGDVLMIRSADRGKSWSAPTTVYEGKTGEPRTMGTLSKLGTGKLVAAVAEMGEGPGPKLVRLLTSQDGGQSWEAGAPLTFPGVRWASPYGRLIEGRQGTLVMSVGTELLPDAPEKGKICAGLIRSTDGGRSWGDFSVIASDPKVSFTQPTLLATGDKSLVALLNNTGEVLYRCRSEDDGYHWTEPQQIQLGREPQLIRIGDQTLAWVFSKGLGWGWIRAGFSYDDGQTWRCDRKVMEHPGEPSGHFGWATGLALDREHIIVAFGHTQRPSLSLDGPGAKRPASAEAERIEVVFFKRDPPFPDPAKKHWKPIPPAARDRWVPAEGLQSGDWPLNFCRKVDGQFVGAIEEGDSLLLVAGGGRAPKYVSNPKPTVKKLRRSADGGRTWKPEPMNLPPAFRGSPGLMTQLSTGRLLCAANDWLLVEWNHESKTVIGHRGGYAIWNPDIQGVQKNRLFVGYSDDDGKTWQGFEEPIDISSFDWAIPNRPFIERSDGTIIFPVFGDVTEQDTRESLNSTALLRSTDGGKTWGDPTIIAYDKEHRRTAYNEMVIVPVRDDLWVAFMRTEYRGVGNESGWTSRAISTDGGYTWSRPELCTLGAAFGAQILPDGGIALGHQGGIRFTYDLGRTWTRLAPSGGYADPILIDDDTLLVGNQQDWGSFSVWRRIPAGKN